MKINKLKTINDFYYNNKIVIFHCNFNSNNIGARIKNSLLTDLSYLVANNAKIVILATYKKIKNYQDLKDKNFSLVDIAMNIFNSFSLQGKSFFINKSYDNETIQKLISELQPKDIIFLENTFFNDIDQETGKLINLESNCDTNLSNYWANLCDFYIENNLDKSYLKLASNFGISKLKKNNSCIGSLVLNDLNQYNKFKNLQSPITLLFNLNLNKENLEIIDFVLEKIDNLILTGPISDLLSLIISKNLDHKKYDSDDIRNLEKIYSKYKSKIVLPIDVIVKRNNNDSDCIICDFIDYKDNFKTIDIGDKSYDKFIEIINKSNVIINCLEFDDDFKFGVGNFFEIYKHITTLKQENKITISCFNGSLPRIEDGCNFYSSYSWASSATIPTLYLLFGNEKKLEVFDNISKKGLFSKFFG